jgi:threonyl-tRNA synthetase
VLEHTDGWLPLWLAPEPLRVLPVSSKQAGEALAVSVALSNVGVRTSVDADGPLGGRVRRAHEQRVPLLAVIGARAAAAGQVSLRARESEGLVSREGLVAGLGAQVAIPRG